ncbi:MAG TPA: DUF3109 family protein [Candidatus Merdimorpha stercoravium]|uniref:DUF3109 family protein n=1 Tax=Candidatus Merdimorpha stercoravium TaxID=2840863 RepID=A0A9D1KTE4_9FLAO|nr:DUF3109 family protein [Candidatus Merdimorpha stercoravium]
MLQIQDTLVSDEVILESFVCDLSRCHGACCVEGDCGAPVEESEKRILEDLLPRIEPYMRPEGIEAVRLQGAWTDDPYDHAPSTPLVNGRECAYLTFSPDGTALCAIEQAYRDGRIAFQKPISCHLYPIRLSRILSFTALNYHRWDICRDACALGRKLGVPVYEFLREPLIRRFGQAWYDELCLTAREYARQIARR